MIANLKAKHLMRVHNLFECFTPASVMDNVIQEARRLYPPLCVHDADGYCLLARMIAHELVGSTVTVYSWHAMVIPPALYWKQFRELRINFPARVRRFVNQADIVPRNDGLIRRSCEVTAPVGTDWNSPVMKGQLR